MYFGDVDSHDGAIYIREKGELRCVNDACEFRRTQFQQPPRLLHKDSSLRLFIDGVIASSTRKDHFVFTYNKEGSLRYSVKSLLDICLLYIADNVQHIESLVGFPEQMADRLFVVAEEKQKFKDPETGLRALQVFCEAYGELVLRSLCLRNRHALLTEKLEEIKTFQNVKCLDLHGCRLGDSHDIFEHITSDSFGRSLSHLLLGGNNMTDTGLQKLTAPVRIMKRGLQNLELLDLSYNPISERALGYLTCLKKLRGLDLTETLVKPSTSLNKLLLCKMRLSPSNTSMVEFCHNHCKTEGWAQEVINQWEVKASKLSQPKKRPLTNALRFYGRERFVRESLNSSLVICNKDDVIMRLQFYKRESNPPTQHTKPTDKTTGAGNGQTVEKGLKRKKNFETEDSVTSSLTARKQFKTSLSQEDLDLLNSY